MSNLPNRNIVLHNEIVKAGQGLPLAEKRILFAGLAQLGGKSNFVTLYADEFAQAFDLTLDTAYRQLKDTTKNIFNRYITYTAVHGKATGVGRARWITAYEYFDNEAYVRFSFNTELFPHLFDLQNKFTKYQLKQASALRSVHSWRLLELFERVRSSTITKKDKDGNTIATKKNDTGWLKISVEDFHHAMETPKSYRNNFKDLRAKVIEPAITELEQKDGWKIDYRTIKKGRKVAMLEFEFYRDPQGRLF